MATAATRAGCLPTRSATRCHGPASIRAPSPGRGTNGQNNRRPNTASSGGSTVSTQTAATTSPHAANAPRLRVLGVEANSRVSNASTTVALLATMAGPAMRTARRRAWR